MDFKLLLERVEYKENLTVSSNLVRQENLRANTLEFSYFSGVPVSSTAQSLTVSETRPSKPSSLPFKSLVTAVVSRPNFTSPEFTTASFRGGNLPHRQVIFSESYVHTS